MPKGSTDTIMVNGTEVPISFTKKGKIDKKSIQAINAAKGQALAEKAISKTKVDPTEIFALLGLTYAYKAGSDVMLEFFGWMFPAVAEAAEKAGQSLKEGIKDLSEGITSLTTSSSAEKEEPLTTFEKVQFQILKEKYRKQLRELKASHARTTELYKQAEEAVAQGGNPAILERLEVRLKKEEEQIEAMKDLMKYLLTGEQSGKMAMVNEGEEKAEDLIEDVEDEVKWEQWLICFGMAYLTIEFARSHTIADFIPMT